MLYAEAVGRAFFFFFFHVHDDGSLFVPMVQWPPVLSVRRRRRTGVTSPPHASIFHERNNFSLLFGRGRRRASRFSAPDETEGHTQHNIIARRPKRSSLEEPLHVYVSPLDRNAIRNGSANPRKDVQGGRHTGGRSSNS